MASWADQGKGGIVLPIRASPLHPLTGTPPSKLECYDWFMGMRINHGTPIYSMEFQLEGGLEMLLGLSSLLGWIT
jgi:hypothetical protein